MKKIKKRKISQMEFNKLVVQVVQIAKRHNDPEPAIEFLRFKAEYIKLNEEEMEFIESLAEGAVS